MTNTRKKYVTFFNALLLFLSISNKINSQNSWFELQNTYEYRKNDFYAIDLENYHLTMAESRLGANFSIRKPGLTFQPYFTIATIYDAGKKTWNNVDWHNNLVYGLGARLRLNPGKLLFLWPREFNIDVFAEAMNVHFFSNDLFYTGHRPKDDIKAGVQYWLSLGETENLKNWSSYFWCDNSGSFYYAKSSFYVRSQTNYYLFNFHSRFGTGCQLPNFLQTELYLTYQLTYDLGSKSWNNLDWLNHFHYGFGGRFKYLYTSTTIVRKLSCVIIPYIEYLQITYADKVAYIPSYRPKNDFRFGLNFWFSVH